MGICGKIKFSVNKLGTGSLEIGKVPSDHRIAGVTGQGDCFIVCVSGDGNPGSTFYEDDFRGIKIIKSSIWVDKNFVI